SEKCIADGTTHIKRIESNSSKCPCSNAAKALLDESQLEGAQQVPVKSASLPSPFAASFRTRVRFCERVCAQSGEKFSNAGRHSRCSMLVGIPRDLIMNIGYVESVNEGFDRLQRLLLAMRAGDELLTSDASRVTGLNERTCNTVFEGLARAGL